GLVVVLLAFFAMEGVSYLTHRFVMHGVGMRIHQRHHTNRDGGFELNDLYPVMFSSVAIMAFTAGTFLPSLRPLVLVGAGVTLYGAAYLFVHEIYIHRRLGPLSRPYRLLEWMKSCHRIHHLYGGEPYGMLLPVVPRELRERAEAVPYDPLLDVRARPSRGPVAVT
ncbi:MAG TPA: sterol desaturase family protein, partial [Chloroflexota bacterium]|nr:sterol desaturase family protein [Chloroflexota bacterium]